MKRVTFVVLGLIVLAVFTFSSKPTFKKEIAKSDQTQVKSKYVNPYYLKN